jgi:hypothetical protein
MMLLGKQAVERLQDLPANSGVVCIATNADDLIGIAVPKCFAEGHH